MPVYTIKLQSPSLSFAASKTLRFIYYNERYVEGFVRWDIGGMLRDGIKAGRPLRAGV